MSKNIGRNLKILAQFLGVFFLLVGLLAGVGLWIYGVSIWICLASFGSGIIFFFGMWPLYGFGQLIEDTTKLRRLAETAANPSRSSHSSDVFTASANYPHK